MEKNSQFITFEGGEGTGKSTVLPLVCKELKQEFPNKEFFISREPGGKDLKFSEKIRALIFENDDIDPLTEAFLFQASRREHVVKVLKPALQAEKIVLCDRFTDSSLIYQGIVEGIEIETIKTLNNIATSNLTPKLTFVFDLDPVIGQKRIESCSEKSLNHFDKEKIDFHRKIQQAYLNLAKTNSSRYQIIDASKPIDAIVEEIVSIIKTII